MLRAADRTALERLGLSYEAEPDGGFINLTITNYLLPDGLTPRTTSLLLRLPGGFPDASPDMFWTADVIRTTSGKRPAATEVIETYAGQSWQRWSRHIDSWRPGLDDLDTLLRFVTHCLLREVEAAAA